MKTVPYCEHLINRFSADPRLQFFIAPMGPFLDPASGAFEDPKFGYKRFYRTLEAHRQALLQPTWKTILSYETDSMTRDQILAASYDAAAELNSLKFRYGLIDSATYERVKLHQRAAKIAIEEIDKALLLPDNQRRDALIEIQRKVEEANVDSLFSKKELDWRGGEGLRFGSMLLRTLSVGLAEEVVHGFNRLVGHYDTSIYQGPRAMPYSEAMRALEAQSPELASNTLLAPRTACQRATHPLILTPEKRFGCLSSCPNHSGRVKPVGIKLGFGPVPITIAFMILLSLGPFQQVGAASATIITATQAKIPVNISAPYSPSDWNDTQMATIAAAGMTVAFKYNSTGLLFLLQWSSGTRTAQTKTVSGALNSDS